MASRPEAPGGTDERQALCDKHGAYGRTSIGGRWTRCPGCLKDLDDAEEAAEKAAILAAHARDESVRREQERLQRLADAGIPARYLGLGFADFETPTANHLHTQTVARDYVEAFAEHRSSGRGLVLAGSLGTGKTMTACLVLQALHEQYIVRYETAATLVRAIRGTWAREAECSEREIFSKLRRFDLLVVDEMGTQAPTESAQQLLAEVLDMRYLDKRPVLIVTNETQAGLRQYLGERPFDRLVETCRWVPFQWPSYRTRADRS